MLGQYEAMDAAGPGWQQALRKNGVQTVLVPPSAPLSQVLAESRAWRLVFFDSVAVVYVQSGAHP